jgi:hypothetical protein
VEIETGLARFLFVWLNLIVQFGRVGFATDWFGPVRTGQVRSGTVRFGKAQFGQGFI